MNLQQINGDLPLAAKERIAKLQGFIAQAEADIQAKFTAHHERRKRGLKRFITPDEFLTLHPEFPTTEEAVLVAEKKAHREELRNQLDSATDPEEIAQLKRSIKTLTLELVDPEGILAAQIDGYQRAKENPRRPLTPEEFDQLYQGPTEADFAGIRAEITSATAEINKLHAFLQSDTVQQPGVYDLDLLDGTALEEPQPQ